MQVRSFTMLAVTTIRPRSRYAEGIVENGSFTLKTRQMSSVHSTPRKFENEAFFPQSGLPSTLIRQ